MAKSFFRGGVHTGVLHRNHITPIAPQLKRCNALFSQDLWQLRLWDVILQICGARV
jgi:hypothetical protein